MYLPSNSDMIHFVNGVWPFETVSSLRCVSEAVAISMAVS